MYSFWTNVCRFKKTRLYHDVDLELKTYNGQALYFLRILSSKPYTFSLATGSSDTLRQCRGEEIGRWRLHVGSATFTWLPHGIVPAASAPRASLVCLHRHCACAVLAHARRMSPSHGRLTHYCAYDSDVRVNKCNRFSGAQLSHVIAGQGVRAVWKNRTHSSELKTGRFW
jgi:hypothetical protein